MTTSDQTSAIIVGLSTHDVRFPTSDALDGSDAMHPDPDYSAAYVILETDQPGLTGHGFTFTIGRGNDLCCYAIEALRHLVVGKSLHEITENMGKFWKSLTSDSQLRWVGPDKGTIHLATSAIINALWDLWAKTEDKPVYQLVADMSPEDLVRCLDFTFVTDCITPSEAIQMIRTAKQGQADRQRQLEEHGYPCYTTGAGWLGYPDEKMRRLCKEAKASGFTHIKMKVGRDLQDDIRRLKIAREELGDDSTIMIDANQVWEVDQAIEWVNALKFARPYFIEEPTSPDDILGHKAIREAVAPVKVATGEMCQNRVMFKQFIMSGAIDIVQIDACRMGGLNEVLLVLLMAAKYDLPVWPHAGGVGLCEYVQHISMIDFLVISASQENRVIEYAGHLHEHFENPVRVENGAYFPPTVPGYSATMKPASIRAFTHKA